MADIVPIPADSYKLGFIGAGKMDESIARGVVKSGLLAGSQIRTAYHANIRRTAFESFGVKMLDHNKQVHPVTGPTLSFFPRICACMSSYIDGAYGCDICGKNTFGNIQLTLLKCDAAVRPFLSEKQLLVSVVAGVKLKDLQVLGTASMVADMGKHPGQLKDDVASPGGTSIAGIHELEKASFRGILMNAVVAASKRSRELSQS
ncbi:pyrroline-5-carboxylate reductase-like isoform X1 [Primulina tabacum]|uniref:pyrroline-5-carboxylate reductase-like isoform X1 n=1 Tax=Primulina tabacum TaxID=48773 RepID=UPI003F5A8979